MRQIPSSLWLSALAALGTAAISLSTVQAYPGGAAGGGAAPAAGGTAAGAPATAAGNTANPGTTGAATAPGSNPPAAGVTPAGTPQTATPTPMTATSQVQTVPGAAQNTAGTAQNPNHVVGPNTANGTQTRLANLPYAGAQPGSLPNQAYGPYGYANGANGSSPPGDPFTNNPNMAAGAYLTPGYFGTGQFGAYAPNSYGNSGYVPGYGASFGSNAAGSYTAGYAPANGYYPSTQNGQNQSSYYRPNGMNRSNQANSAPRPAAQGRTQYGWW